VKLIIAGSRALYPREVMTAEVGRLESRLTASISGGARGVDLCAQFVAAKFGIPCTVMRADWAGGRQAGFHRNEQMGNYADALLAFWDGQSRGTMHMIRYMRDLNKPVRVYTFVRSEPILTITVDSEAFK